MHGIVDADSFQGFAFLMLCIFILPETYGPRILQRKATRLRKQTGDGSLRCTQDDGKTTWKLLRQSVIRPTSMLLRYPLIGLVSLLLAIAYSYLYLMFTTLTEVFEDTYDFESSVVGLTYLGIGIGSMIGQYGMDMIMSSLRGRISRRGGVPKPEDYLVPLAPAAVVLSMGLFMYGWSAQYRTHWIVPIIGTGVCGLGITPFFVAVQTYLVEAYTEHAASALAASSAIRCIFGVALPVAGPPLYENLGLGWGNSVLGFLALIVVPASLWLKMRGEGLRMDSR